MFLASRLKDTELIFDNNLPKNFNGGKWPVKIL